MQCTAIRPDGTPCRGNANRGTEFCTFHTPPDAERPAVGKDLGARTESDQSKIQNPKSKIPPVDPLLVGGAMQQMLLKQEIEDRLRQSRGRQKQRDRDGYELPEPAAQMPFRVVPRRRAVDSTVPVEPAESPRHGQPPLALRPDFVQRYVRERDHMDRPTQSRVEEFKEYGYEIVTHDDGTPYRNRLGVLMQAPPEQYALRASEKTPKGAALRDDALLMAMDMADAANRTAGDDVARVVVDQEHRTVRTLEGTGVERVE